jgi:flagellar assembly factor FliW
MAHSTSDKLNKVNAQILEEQAKLKQAIANIELIAQLTILTNKSLMEYHMGKEKFKPIEVDEVVNNPELLRKEYDITFNQETGKLFIANNAKESTVIMQLMAYNMHPDRDQLMGLAVDKTDPKDARLSGIFYLQNLPVDLMEAIKPLEEKPNMGRGAESVRENKKADEEAKIDIGKEYASLEEYEKDHSTGDDKDPFGLVKSNPKTLKAPAGLSRQGRKEWWEKLRAIHPTAFDKGGNWIGFDKDNLSAYIKPEAEVTKQDKTPSTNPNATLTFVKPVVVKDKAAFGLLRETGVGNLVTTIIDARITKDCYFIGRYFQQKNGFVIASTPAVLNNDKVSAMLFFEKFKTADFILKGLLKSPSWENKLEGCGIHPITQLSSAVRTDKDRHVYYITNGVTALMALGNQKKRVDNAEYVEVKD